MDKWPNARCGHVSFFYRTDGAVGADLFGIARAALMPFGTGLFLWLRDSETARWIVGIGAALIALLTWDRLRTNRIRREARAKAERRAEKQSDKILQQMENDSEERIQDALEARERVPDGITSDQLRDDARSILFGRGRNGGGGR